MYRANLTGITWRVKKILAVALGDTGPAPEGKAQAEMALPVVPGEAARKRGEQHLATLPPGAKRERMEAVFKRYMEGESMNEIVAATGVSKASVSEYLNEIETMAGCRIVRGRPTGRSFAAQLRANKGLLLEERAGGLRRASVRDFHSLRVTWVTLALTAGVPLELVQKVTGHKTTDVVLKHYFQPGREAFRAALNAAMPKLLMNEAPKIAGGMLQAELEVTAKTEEGGRRTVAGRRDGKLRGILKRSTAKSWQADRARLLAMLKI